MTALPGTSLKSEDTVINTLLFADEQVLLPEFKAEPQFYKGL
jgi:hypothetical protein